ncbi:P-loop containing nucleoside triphosphate hydrolase protein [Lanmaoa asiatica]|nr:P-loop containing nucleoside triphosphate hydrolase protein [Lanmaoa asiatica]
MSFTITQNLFVNESATITVVKCNDDDLNTQHLQPLLDTTSHVLGVAAIYDKQCQLSLLGFSTLSQALVVNIPTRHVPQPKQATKQQRVARSRSLIQDRLLLNTELQKSGFKMDQLAWPPVIAGNLLQALMNGMGGEEKLHRKNVQSLFFDTSESPAVDVAAKVALKAWAACRAATFPHMSSQFASLARIDTMTLPKAHLDALARISRHAERLEALKPTTVKNDVTDQFTVKKGAINLKCSRFPTRIRPSTNQEIRIEIKGKETTSQVVGRARKVDGRNARINIKGPVQGDKIVSVTTVGKENPTCAESTRDAIVLKALQHKTNILSNPFFRALWLPKERLVWPESKRQRRALPPVQRILSDKDDDRIVVIHGPPGTGKTTVIAASVISHDCADSKQGIWVVAQSNVAVKNIAEKFIKEGFRKFKLLVSRDFHYDWHEHLYEELESCLIRSDRFKMSIVDASRLLLDCKVILCTLSMFCNPSISEFLRVVPVEAIILDEASQIECGDYLPMLHHFQSTLSKLVFIGDNKQLPPYGQEDVPELRSVFEFPHLRKRAVFLNTQYRMPHVIGTFISWNVYGAKLFTLHDSTNPEACRFIDVNKGRETKKGHSWINFEEARIVAKLARSYESRKKSFRIITPYDAQRSLIENQLKSEDLQWQDKVFNVDSFQGNEDDHIIVSVVRSHSPGFLRNQRRTNVMLTRCKRSMVVCSSRAFLFGKASGTLVGKLAASLDEKNWINGHDVLCGRVQVELLA